VKSPLRVSVFLLFSIVAVASFAAQPGASKLNAGDSSGAGSDTARVFVIPGPQRSFLRMAGISQKVRPEQVLPLLSRNVFIQGYEGSDHPTEFLVLLRRYVVQARELSALASNNGMVIRVSNCDDAKPLLRILGYRPRTDCGQPTTTLLTDDPERAFLSIDSGFPLPELERTLQGGKPFEYEYSSSEVPVLFAGSDWTMASKKNYTENSRDLLETILHDPDVARLYWALSRLDPETARSLQESIGIQKLLPYGAVLDFYGRELYISQGQVRVPGGTEADGAWKDLVGASPTIPAAFVSRLIARDHGWLAAFFDVLSRADEKQQAYFSEPRRMHAFYNALRAPDPSAKATRGTFRPAPSLLLLATRLHFDDSGEPLIPGGIEEWKDILYSGQNRNLVRKWARQSHPPGGPDDFIQIMFALTRSTSDVNPLDAYMAISELDSRRPPSRRLAPATVRLLARHFQYYSDQYRIFSEFPELTDESISLFMETVLRLNNAPVAYRANAFGIFQANVGIWQILARQGEISNSHLNDSWERVVRPFSGIRSGAQLYDAGRNSLAEIFRFSTGKPHGSQDEIIELLAGPAQSTPGGKEMHREIANRIRAVLDDQRLVSLDTLNTIGDGLAQKASGKHPEEYVALAANETREFEMPRPIFTESERYQWAAGIYNNHHTDTEMRTDLPRLLKTPATSRSQIDDARGQLTSFLRDTLVGLSYAYYEPPGAQALHSNPLFVRSHDFAGESVGGIKDLWQAPSILGEGTPAGGGAHFVGSIADLPFALAEMEQDFIAPSAVQALIWKEMAPEMLASAVLPRWWNVTPIELHAVALYQRSGEELLAGSADDETLRAKVLAILEKRQLPQRLRQIERALHTGGASDLISQLMPSDTFYLAAEFQRLYPDSAPPGASATRELQELCREHPDQVNWIRLSHDFGTPHPNLAQNDGLELLNVGPMPPFAGRASSFLAESLDSPNLYWARLADEAGYSPVMLHYLVPQLTRVMIEKIFATDFEDWPAVLRAMHEAGSEFKEGKLPPPPGVNIPSSASSHVPIGE
jgi:hypothetical protein